MTSTATTPRSSTEQEHPSCSAVEFGEHQPRDDGPPARATSLLQSLLDLRHLLGGEWNADILVILLAGPHRYTELLDAVKTNAAVDRRSGRCRHAQTRTFVYTLRRMEADGLITRSEQEGVWPRQVHYELTPAATDLVARLASTLQRGHIPLP